MYFVSALRDTATHNSDLYVASKPPGASAWTPVVRLAGVSSATEFDHLPVVARTGDSLSLVWVRHDTTQALPWLNPKSHLYNATSTDGLAWSTPSRITQDTDLVVNLFPALFPSHAGVWSLVWLSTSVSPPVAES